MDLTGDTRSLGYSSYKLPGLVPGGCALNARLFDEASLFEKTLHRGF